MKRRWLKGARQARGVFSRTLVAIGNFDGVHQGHQQVLREACSLARERGLTPLVLTFDPHPAQVLSKKNVRQLCTLERKIELVLRIDPALWVVVEPFDLALSRMSPREFASAILHEGLDAAVVLVGNNFRFGYQRAGDLALLAELGQSLGFEALALPLVGDEEGVFSSTRVREALSRGELHTVERILGRPHSLSGRVVRGEELGRTLGFPTANLEGVDELLPRHGVYACTVDQRDTEGFERLGSGVLNVGVRPTLGTGPSIEVHVFDFHRDLYDRELRVHLVERLRDERRFDSLDELKSQIGRDASRARELLRELKPAPEAGQAWF